MISGIANKRAFKRVPDKVKNLVELCAILCTLYVHNNVTQYILLFFEITKLAKV